MADVHVAVSREGTDMECLRCHANARLAEGPFTARIAVMNAFVAAHERCLPRVETKAPSRR